MREGKYTYRLNIGDGYQVGETESWLTDMAMEGKHLDKFGPFLVRFCKGEPRSMRYRMDFQPEADEEERKELQAAYGEAGWEYVGRCGTAFQIYRSEEGDDAPELHTDPAEQGCGLKFLQKRLTNCAVVSVLLGIVNFALLSFIWFGGINPVEAFIMGRTLQQLLQAALLLYLLVQSILQLAAIRRMRVALLEGRPVNHRADWKRAKKKRCRSLALLLVVAFFTIGLSTAALVQLDNGSRQSLPSEDAQVLQLSDFQGDLTYGPPLAGMEGQDLEENYYDKEWTPFATVFTSYERAGGELDVHLLNTELYRLRPMVEKAAQPLAEELMRRYDNEEYLKERGMFLKKIADPRFDYLEAAQSSNYIEMTAVKDGSVLYLSYHGTAPLEKVLSAAADRL